MVEGPPPPKLCEDTEGPVLVTGTSVDLGCAANRNSPMVVGGQVRFDDVFTESQNIQIRLTAGPSTGTLMLNGAVLAAGDVISQMDLDEGRVRFVPADDDSTSSSFTVVGIDEAGNESDPAEITLTFSRLETEVTKRGTNDADNIFGDEGVNDLIILRGGDDFATGGSGNDEMRGGSGDDTMHGHDGDDAIFGQAGDDFITGGEGCDTLVGGSGDDILDGHGGDDTIEGGSGNDRVHGNEGDDRLFGGGGDDVMEGGSGNDLMLGGSGDDGMQGEGGDDVMFGNDGDDKLEGNDGNDWMDGGRGDDMVIGHGGDDILFGRDGDDILEGHDGDDTLEGGRGNDFLEGHGGHDTFVFRKETGEDTIQNFNIHEDTLEILCRDGITTAQDVLDAQVQDGLDTIIDLGNGDTITLLFGINFQLTEDNIVILH